MITKASHWRYERKQILFIGVKNMNLSELVGKEIVNIVSGERLGVIGECDIIIDETTGKILALSIPRERGFFGIKRDRGDLEIPWRNVKKIGNDMIIIEYDGIY